MNGCDSACSNFFFLHTCTAAQECLKKQVLGVVDRKPRNKMKHSLEEINQAGNVKVLKMET